ncbi:hypothetical protein HDV00_012801 [Rhizophlyctis rosea]|nr:hypothetical protein HDV00_012801 [Rhizophlyctis rosea]
MSNLSRTATLALILGATSNVLTQDTCTTTTITPPATTVSITPPPVTVTITATDAPRLCDCPSSVTLTRPPACPTDRAAAYQFCVQTTLAYGTMTARCGTGIVDCFGPTTRITTTTTTTRTTTTTQQLEFCTPKYQQCGGIGWTGATVSDLIEDFAMECLINY